MIKDSGNRTKFESGAVRDIQEGKGRCDLLPLSVVGCWCEDSAYDILGCIDLYRLHPSTEKMSAILNKFASKHRNTVDTCKGLERYRWDLVLEVSKHFEDGAKKYGDRNWEKGIPCDRYIDSAVRHYCKWRAGWTDEPHDRAFMWNILCCEWTRLRYGWDLERLDEKMGSSESESRKYVRIGEQFSKAILDSIERADEAFSKAFSESPLTVHVKTSLNGDEEVNNRYIRNVAGGVELYDDAGTFVGYVHGLVGSVKSEADIRSIVEKSWGLLTLNPFTLEKIIEDHGYIADIHFIIEMYKNPGDIKLPDDWQLIKRKAKEDRKNEN